MGVKKKGFPGTGRQSREPSIQNLPVRTKLGKEIRDAFHKDVPVIEIDYKGLEQRIYDRFKKK